MATAQKIVTDALTNLRMQSELIPVDPQLEADAFQRLVEMLQQWGSVGINLGLTIPTLITDEMDNPVATNLALAYSLALEMAPRAPQEIPPRLMANFKRSRRRLKAAYTTQAAQEFPSSLPLGQGSNTGPRSKRYFPEPDAIGGSSTGLGT